MPSEFTPTLSQGDKRELIDSYRSGAEPAVVNRLQGVSSVDTLCTHFGAFSLSSAQLIELIRLPQTQGDSLVAVINTWYGPAADSNVTFYTLAWQELPTADRLPTLTVDDFFARDTLSVGDALSRDTLSADDALSRDTLSADDALSRDTLSVGDALSRDTLSAGDSLSRDTLSAGDALSRDTLSAGDALSRDTLSVGDALSRATLSAGDALSRDTLSVGDALSRDTLSAGDSLSRDTLSVGDALSRDTLSVGDSLSRDTLSAARRQELTAWFDPLLIALTYDLNTGLVEATLALPFTPTDDREEITRLLIPRHLRWNGTQFVLLPL